ncbi:MAG TPA: LysR family transcriptional regulator [Candidatus Dormibacteraeota bacterium]|nr:LysR family transcriptional regulator [Candidatus Dormibacteraeota bacterium]
MDFDQLITFLEVAKLGGFSRAGQKLFRSQPAVSAQIRQLELEYGEKLFNRTGKAVRLTTAGETLFEYAGRLLTLRNESLRAVADQASTPRGTLAIGANEATCLYVLPNVFAEYHRLYPAVQISIYRNFSHKVVQKVEDGTIDVGVVTLPIKSPSLKVYSIFRDRVMLMVSPENSLARHKTVQTKEIAEQPLIFPKTGFTRQLLDKYFQPYRSRLRVTMELPSVSMIKCFVAAGLGVSLISSGFARDEVLAGKVKLIPIADVELWRELGLVYRRDRVLPNAVEVFCNLIRQPGAIESQPSPVSKPPLEAKAIKAKSSKARQKN